MDAKIENGGYVTDSCGQILMIDGFDEIVQQVLMKIKIPKGKFIYDRGLGSFCSSFDYNTGKNKIKNLEMLINESLVSLEDTYVTVNSAEDTSEGLKAEITICSGGFNATREVII